jgi:hypothetical protein
MGLIGRAVATAGVVAVYSIINTVHEIMSPLISGPMAAQQLTDSNAGYTGTQVASRVFNGNGVSGAWLGLVAVAVLIAIWYRPFVNLFYNKVND